MERRRLGRTGLQVSCVSVGTVELGQDYGIPVPGDFGRPQHDEAIALLQSAADSGVNVFDTAPTYGSSEELLGMALSKRADCCFATKITVPLHDGRPAYGARLRHAVEKSLAESLRRLRRDVLDIVQIHNATVSVIHEGEMVDALLHAQRQGKIRFLGATVYTEAEALAIIEAGCFDVLQVPYNVLDQRMARQVLPAAAAAGVGIMVRSALLKGALTSKAQWLPEELASLRGAVEHAKDTFSACWHSLPEFALRFCLSTRAAATVLVGARTRQELAQASKAVEAGPLEDEIARRTPALALSDEHLVNPSYWPVS